MDDATKESTRLGIEFITAAAIAETEGSPALMQDTAHRIVSVPTPYNPSYASAPQEVVALANAMHLLYGVSSVTRRALVKLSECRGGVPLLSLMEEIGRDLAEE